MPSTSTLVDSIYTRRVSAGECYPPDLVKSQFYWPKGGQNYWLLTEGQAFWHENSLGLPELSVNQGSAAEVLGLTVGDPLPFSI